MGRERLKQILDEISTTRVAVLGDFCLDAYWMIDPRAGEVSLETGKRTQPVGEAARLANFASAVTVQKLFQCGTASPEEILRIGNSPDWVPTLS